MKKRVISLVLCLLMALSLLPTAVFAADDVVDDSVAIELQAQENEAVAYIDGGGGHEGGDHGKPDGGDHGGGHGGNPGGEYKDPDPDTFAATHIDVDFDGTITYNGEKYDTIISNVKASFSGQEYTIEGVRDNERQWHKDFSDGSRPTYNTPVTIKCTATVYDNNGEVFLTKDIEVTYSTVEEFNWAVEHCKTDDGFDFNITAVVQEQIESTIDITVTKNWNNKDGDFVVPLRDDQTVTVTLYADGQPTSQTTVLSKENQWSYTFRGLSDKSVYTVVETPVPGYIGTEGNKENGYVITNTPNWIAADDQKAELKIAKVDEQNALITTSAATFQLTKDGEAPVTAKTVNGICTFTDLTTGTYTLTEAIAPKGYAKSGAVWTITVSGESVLDTVYNENDAVIGYKKYTRYHIDSVTEGQIEYAFDQTLGAYAFSNSKDIGEDINNFASVTIVKVDKDDHAKKLEGVVFGLYKGEKFDLDKPYATATTDKDGKLTFSGLTDGEYTIREIRAHEGYQASSLSWSFTVDNIDPTADIAGDKFVTTNNYKVTVVNSKELTSPVQDYTFTIENEKIPSTEYTVSIPVSKKIEVATGSNQPASIPNFIFEAYLGDKKVGTLEFKDMTKGKDGVYSGNLPVTLTADDLRSHVDQQGKITLTIKEAGSTLHWTYDTKTYDISVVFDGDTPILEDKNITFTNKYNYTPGPGPKPNPKPTPKPIPSVKTGDMGIALYAMTSLLSLGGTALVIKKRKDEE